jgi:hypothetical protein
VPRLDTSLRQINITKATRERGNGSSYLKQISSASENNLQASVARIPALFAVLNRLVWTLLCSVKLDVLSLHHYYALDKVNPRGCPDLNCTKEYLFVADRGVEIFWWSNHPSTSS